MKLIKAALLATLGLALLGCAALAQAPIPGLSDADLNQAGKQAFEKIKTEVPEETDPGINNYIKCIANAIVAEAEDPTGVSSWTVVVFRDASANAFALPGGYIGVHTGLLSVAKNTDQLAAVLGHEVAHVTLRHGKQRVMQQTGLQKVTEILGKSSETVAGVLGAGGTYAVLMPFSRQHESQADIEGLKYMAKAGFNPAESVRLWNNMKEAGAGKQPQILSTHPSPEKRMTDLANEVPKQLATYELARRSGKGQSCKR